MGPFGAGAAGVLYYSIIGRLLVIWQLTTLIWKAMRSRGKYQASLFRPSRIMSGVSLRFSLQGKGLHHLGQPSLEPDLAHSRKLGISEEMIVRAGDV